MLRFTGTPLHAVLAEAGIHGCRVILVKDQGIYLMAEVGENHPDGGRKRVAYAIGCNPEVDAFEVWWHRAVDEFGGDDFAEYFDIDDPVLASLRGTDGSLLVEATPTHLLLAAEIFNATKNRGIQALRTPSPAAPPMRGFPFHHAARSSPPSTA